MFTDEMDIPSAWLFHCFLVHTIIGDGYREGNRSKIDQENLFGEAKRTAGIRMPRHAEHIAELALVVTWMYLSCVGVVLPITIPRFSTVDFFPSIRNQPIL